MMLLNSPSAETVEISCSKGSSSSSRSNRFERSKALERNEVMERFERKVASATGENAAKPMIKAE